MTHIATDKKILVVIIYDISDNKRRTKLGNFLSGYGIRVQNSAFECFINESLYRTLFRGIEKYLKPEDLIKIYKIDLASRVINQGLNPEEEISEVIIV